MILAGVFVLIEEGVGVGVCPVLMDNEKSRSEGTRKIFMPVVLKPNILPNSIKNPTEEINKCGM